MSTYYKGFIRATSEVVSTLQGAGVKLRELPASAPGDIDSFTLPEGVTLEDLGLRYISGNPAVCGKIIKM